MKEWVAKKFPEELFTHICPIYQCTLYMYLISSHKTRRYYYFAKPSNTGFIRKHCIIISKDIHTNLWKSSFMDSSQKIFFLKKLQKSGYFHFMAYMLNQCWAFSNDCLNLIFVKKFYVLGKKEPEMVVKWPLINRKFSWDFSYKIAEIWQWKIFILIS